MTTGVRRRPLRWERVAVSCLTVIAVALRVYRLEAQSLWSDEGLSVYRSALPVIDILRNVIVVDGVVTRDLSPPGYFLLLAAWRAVAGDVAFTLRFPGALLGALAVPLAWRAARPWTGRAAAMACAALMAISPLHVWYSQELRNYSLLIALIWAATWALARAFGNSRRSKTTVTISPSEASRSSSSETQRARTNQRNRWRPIMVWAALWAAAVATHAFAVLALAAHVLFVIGRAILRRSGTALLAALGAAIVLALPLSPRAVSYFRSPTQVDYGPIGAATILLQTLDAFAVGISPTLSHPWSAVWPLALLALLGCLWGTWRPGQRRGFILALLLTAVPLALLALLSTIRPIYNGPRHAIVALPGFLMLCALGFDGLVTSLAQLLTAKRSIPGSRSLRRRSPYIVRRGHLTAAGTSGRPVLALIVAISLTSGLTTVAVQALQLHRQFHDSDYVKDDIRGAARDLSRMARVNDQIVLHDPLIQFAFRYEYERAGGRTPWQTIPRFGEDPESARDRLLQLGDEAERVWLLERPAPRTGFDRNFIIGQAEEAWTRADERSYRRTWLLVRWSRFDTPRAALAARGESPSPLPEYGTAVGAHLGQGLVLEAVADCKQMQPMRDETTGLALLRASAQRICVELHWRMDEPVERDWVAFVHVVPTVADSPVAQHDGPPSDTLLGLGALSTWPAGVVAIDRRDIDLPPDLPRGSLVVVGLYDLDTGERASITDRAGRPLGDALLLARVKP